MPGRGEAPRPDAREVEAATATPGPESPAPTAHLMEAICDPGNIEAALACGGAQQGSARRRRHDRSTTAGHSRSALAGDRRSTAAGALPAAAGASGAKSRSRPAGHANLGIPTVIDRVIQQAVLQRLQPLWDPTFSEHSYGFRPGRSAHQAVAQAQAYVADRLSVRRGHRPGEILRPGQPRQADGAGGRARD